MSEVKETPGQRLRAERERQGLSAQKAADQLHLDGWVIEALESGDYARIGPSVYGKGHLKRYAGLLGLPAAEILEAYDARSSAPAPTAQSSTLGMRTSDAPARGLPWLPIAGVAVVAVIVAGVLWRRPWQTTARTTASVTVEERAPPGVSSREPAAADQAVDGGARTGGARTGDGGAPAVASTAGGPAATGALTGGTVAAGASGVRPAVSPSETDSTAGVGRARLRLSFSADSWVDVHDARGRRLYAGYGRANSVKTIAGAAPLRVYLGFASGVQLEVNNHVVAIGPQFVAGDVAHFEAGADGVLRRDAHISTASNPPPHG